MRVRAARGRARRRPLCRRLPCLAIAIMPTILRLAAWIHCTAEAADERTRVPSLAVGAAREVEAFRPAAPSQHVAIAGLGAVRVVGGPVAIVVRLVPVGRPLPDVARHVQDAVRTRSL